MACPGGLVSGTILGSTRQAHTELWQLAEIANWQQCIFCVSSSSGHEQCNQHAILMAVVLMPLAIRYEPASASQKSAIRKDVATHQHDHASVAQYGSDARSSF